MSTIEDLLAYHVREADNYGEQRDVQESLLMEYESYPGPANAPPYPAQKAKSCRTMIVYYQSQRQKHLYWIDILEEVIRERKAD